MFENVLKALLADATGALVAGALILGLLASSEAAFRLLRLPNEITRKASHVGSGVVILAFPWLLDSAWTVSLLAVAFLGILWAGRKTGMLGSIHAVDRRTGGAWYYPVAVLAIWLLSGGDALTFTVPVAIMALADTGAAWVGKSVGEAVFPVLDGHRTFEGSATFFGLAFTVSMVGVGLAGRPGWPAALLVALVVALLTTAVEAVSVRGSDNLFIPYAAWMVLDRTLTLGLPELSSWIAGMLAGVLLVVGTWRAARMTPAGALLTFVLATLALALGGLPWLLPLVALHVLYVALRPPRLATDLDVVFPSTSGSLLVVLLYAHLGDAALYLPFLVTVAANGAMAMALAARSRYPSGAFGVTGHLAWATAVLVGALLPAVVPWLLGVEVPVALVALGGMLGLPLALLLARTRLKGRRLVASVGTGLLAWWAFAALSPVP